MLLCSYDFVYGQELNWLYKVGGQSDEYGAGIVVDRIQNIYDIVNFSGTVSVDSGLNFTASNDGDVLIRKTTPFGIRMWVFQLSSNVKVEATSIIVDNSTDIYVSGSFTDSLFYRGEYLLESNNGNVSSFILKLDGSGNIIWHKMLESTVSIQSISMSSDLLDGLIVVGNFSGEATFGSGIVSPSTFGYNNIFLLHINNINGNSVFAKYFNGNNIAKVNKVTLDKSGYIFLAGEFEGELDINPGANPYLLQSAGKTDAFLVKLSPAGVIQWGNSYGSTGDDSAKDVIVDYLSDIILTGSFSNTVSFNSLGDSVISKGERDVYIAKIDTEGNTLWVNSYGSTGKDEGKTLTTNSTGIIYLGGTFRGEVDFNPSSSLVNSSLSFGGDDVFIAVYNQDGTYNSHLAFGGTENDNIAGLSVKYDGEVIVTGAFRTIVDFDPSSDELNIFSNGGEDAYLVNVTICVYPYIKSIAVDNPEFCEGGRVFINISKGYLNDAAQWSWYKNSCEEVSFAIGPFISVDVDATTSFYVKGIGGCANEGECIEIEIKVHEDTIYQQDASLCEGDSVIVGNNIYKETGMYIDSLLRANGCDSIVHTQVTVFPKYHFNQNISICLGDTLKVGDSRYTIKGTYTNLFQTIDGCDSLITTILDILPRNIGTAEATICKGDSVKIGDEVYYSPGTFLQSEFNEYGCEDVIVVTIDQIETEFESFISICTGDSLIVGSSVYDQSGIYIDTLLSSAGCDSIITTHLSVYDSSSEELRITLCEGDSIRIGNSIYKEKGFYLDTIPNFYGCDSIIYTGVTIIPKIDITALSFDICEGDTLSVAGSYYTASGLYRDTLTTHTGCDSIIQIDLKVVPIFESKNVQICEGESVNIGNNSFKETGKYEITLENQLGCDSIVALDLTVIPIITTSTNYRLCPGDSIYIDGNVFFEEGIFTDTLTSIDGCDSILVYVVKFNHTVQNLDYNICKGEFIVVNNVAYTEPGFYTDTLVQSDGCDSIFNINIVVHPHIELDTIFTLCKGDFVRVGDNEYSEPGTYTEALSSIFGCDSIVRFEVKILEFETTFSRSGDTLIANELEDASYQWYLCIEDNRVPVFGGNQSTLAVGASGLYSLGVTYNGCTYYSDCVNVMISATDDTVKDNLGMEFFPNPVSHSLNLKIREKGHLKIMTSHGVEVFERRFLPGTYIVDTEFLISGSYFIEWRTKLGRTHHTLIKI